MSSTIYLRPGAVAPVLGLILVLFLSSFAISQCKDMGIKEVYADATHIFVTFMVPVTEKDGLTVPSRWRVINISDGTITEVGIQNGIVLRYIDVPGSFLYAELPYSGAFKSGKKYLLYVEGLTFDGCNPNKEAMAVISPPARPLPPNATPTPTPEPSAYGASKANGRSDADIYISGAIEGVRRDKAIKTIDLKFELPIAKKVFQSDQLIVPYIDLKASSNAKADADSLKTGLILRTPFKTPGAGKEQEGRSWFSKIVPGMVWDIDGRIEGNKNIRFINGIFANKLSFVTKVIGDGNVQLYFQPFVGLELGRNMRTPVTEAVDQKIVRPLFGSSAYLNIWIEKPLLDTISIQSDYTRRWSIAREFGVNKTNDLFVPVAAGKGPRDYVQTKVELGFNKYFGFALGHEYGRLPPNFKLLEHKFTAGLVFKSKLIYRPK